MRHVSYSFRFAEEVLNSRLAIKQEVERVIGDLRYEKDHLSRPGFNKRLRDLLVPLGWADQPEVFAEQDDVGARMDFLKERVGMEVGFGHASFLGIDLLKFQVSSYSSLDKIDIGIYITTTREFQKYAQTEFVQNWEGSLTFEKVTRYLPHFKSAIQVPIWVIGIDRR